MTTPHIFLPEPSAGKHGLSLTAEGGVLPRWTGEPLDGRTLLVMSGSISGRATAQGVGSDLAALRLLPLVKDRARPAHIVAVLDPRLIAITAGALPGWVTVTTLDGLAECGTLDAWVPVGTLTELLRATPNDVAGLTPPLAALRTGRGAGIGFAHRPSLGAVARSPWRRDTPLAAWAGVARTPGAVCLVHDLTANERRTLCRTGAEVPTPFPDLPDLFRRIAALERVITVDCTAAWIALAVGTPATLLVDRQLNVCWGGRDPRLLWGDGVKLLRAPVESWASCLSRALLSRPHTA